MDLFDAKKKKIKKNDNLIEIIIRKTETNEIINTTVFH